MRVVTSYPVMGQLISSVVNWLILYTYSPVLYPYIRGSYENVPGGVITTVCEHIICIFPL